MKVRELRRLVNALPVTVDDEDLTVVDHDSAEDFDVITLGVDVDGTPVMQIELR
ncbi:hypothetical protein ACGFZB_28860 [Streptomyces cinerochromogenes]|uniref:Uncharacterized protein n=1 Tax=Streptomyces cinerochromogenes TaxID=66422 RepID=A0ABW7BF88_9ACTN